MVNSLTATKINNLQIKQLKKAKEALINKNYTEIYNHEAAHKSVAGDLGGSMHIVKNGAGIPVSGFVPIKVPGVPNSKNPSLLEKTINQAKTVIKSAMAPKDPSAADFSVKASAERVLNKTENIKNNSKANNKPLNYMA